MSFVFHRRLFFPGPFWASSTYDDQIADDHMYVYFMRLSLNVQKGVLVFRTLVVFVKFSSNENSEFA